MTKTRADSELQPQKPPLGTNRRTTGEEFQPEGLRGEAEADMGPNSC